METNRAHQKKTHHHGAHNHNKLLSLLGENIWMNASNYYLIWSRSFPARLRDVWDLYYTKGCKKQEPRMEIHHQQQWECDTPPGEGCCDVIVYYIIIDNKQLSRWCGLVSASALAPVMAWDTCLTQDTWHTWLSADSSTWTRGWWLSLKQARLRWHKCIMLEYISRLLTISQVEMFSFPSCCSCHIMNLLSWFCTSKGLNVHKRMQKSWLNTPQFKEYKNWTQYNSIISNLLVKYCKFFVSTN